MVNKSKVETDLVKAQLILPSQKDTTDKKLAHDLLKSKQCGMSVLSEIN